MKTHFPKPASLVAIIVAAGVGALLAYFFEVQVWLAALIGVLIVLPIQLLFSLCDYHQSP